MKVDVTQEDIDQGKRFDWAACPVANAIKRILGDAMFVEVNYKYVYFAPYCEKASRLSEAARKRIKTYDLTGEMQPFTLVLA